MTFGSIYKGSAFDAVGSSLLMGGLAGWRDRNLRRTIYFAVRDSDPCLFLVATVKTVQFGLRASCPQGYLCGCERLPGVACGSLIIHSGFEYICHYGQVTVTQINCSPRETIAPSDFTVFQFGWL